MNTLRSQNDAEILADSIELLNYISSSKDLTGRKDISDLVNETVGKIPDADERTLADKILGGNVISRKDRLAKLADAIEEKTK